MLSEKGDRRGIEDEIIRLEEKLKELDSLPLSDDERNNYEQNKHLIEESTKLRDQINKDVFQLEKLRELSLVRQDIEYDFSIISETARENIVELYNALKADLDNRWVEGVNERIFYLNQNVEIEDDKIRLSELNPDYVKANKAYRNSTQLNEIQDRIKEQKSKLNEVNSISNEVEELEKQKTQLKDKIVPCHTEYFSVTEELLPNLSDSQDGLDINAKCQFNQERYSSILEGALNLQSLSSREITEFEYKNNTQYIERVSFLMESLFAGSINLKGGYTQQSLAMAILTECFYGVFYDLVYENDNFNQMSDGKKAFVVLKLLLDFSDKKCPILIDQPEDDLDNRAIYLDLVQYLKGKKTLRQIIVATHNPNIVVGSDSELVIVANQHGVKNENVDSKKFSYKSGSLEHSSPFDSGNPIVLDSQGIREHVCVILEGGDVAFKLREKKYSIG